MTITDMTEADSKENGMTRPSYDQFVRFFYYEKERFERMNEWVVQRTTKGINEWMDEWMKE